MPDIIQLLPDSIANQIAAGEVIQRPASAVKELMENSIDAGGTFIQLIIKDAGKQLIQVVDDGCGMSDTDARMSFERHATSKIKTTDDLFNIRTMGFRGEALASISAIAQVELKSKKQEEESGTFILIEGSRVKRQEPVSCNAGTSISIKNLFYNIPARRNFLKSNAVETRHIIDEFQRIALAYPSLGFSMHHNDSEIFHLPAENLRKRIIRIFGNNYNQRLVPVDEETPIVTINGFIGKPEFSKKTRGEQYFFVNNRFIKSPYLNHAIMNGYQDLIPQKNYPLYVLFIDLDPARIDINVHPTKQEIKFEDERIIYTYLHAAVKRALGRHSITPTLDFERETSFETFSVPPEGFKGNQDSEGYSPFSTVQKREKPVQDWPEFLKTGEIQTGNTITVKSEWEQGGQQQDISGMPQRVKPYQFHSSYIFTTIKDGMIVIDQQAAHERILYNRYNTSSEGEKMASQKSMFPQTLEFNTSDSQMIRDLLDIINELGFDIQEFGNNDFVVHAIPADLAGFNELELIEGILENFKANRSSLNIDKRENLYRSMAVKAAIKKGTALNETEMNNLIDELFACTDFMQSPSGKLTFIKYTLQELDRQFEKKR